MLRTSTGCARTSMRSEEAEIGLPSQPLEPGLVPPDPVAVPPRRRVRAACPCASRGGGGDRGADQPEAGCEVAADRAASVDENSPRLQNWNHAPFAYTNPEGSYLLGPVHGVMEAAGDEDAALAIAIRRRETFLSRTSEPPLDLDMRVLSTRIAGEFADLTAMALDMAQAARWEIGRQLLDAGASGAVFRRAERPVAQFIAVFDAALLERSLQRTHYRFVWDGTVIKSVYDFGSGREIKREDLVPGSSGREAA